ncbi:hypothetical protein KXD40_005668 [Peronospora effusa]|nr:hypothetical protein KXD40_005668 [Peronospora effusa]
MKINNVVEAEEGQQTEEPKMLLTTLNGEEGTDDGRFVVKLPGGYSRWLLKRDEEKEPLCDEINLFLRSHGLREISSVDTRHQLTAFVTTFQAANTWLHQAKVEYPSNVKSLHWSRRAPRDISSSCAATTIVASAYVNYDNCTVHVVKVNKVLATSNGHTTILANGDAAKHLIQALSLRLFDWICARVQSEIETRNIQLVLEKTLARKKLLDAEFLLTR